MSRALREISCFALVLAAVVSGLLWESLFGGKVLSPADVLLVEESFRDLRPADYEPANRLLMDPALQFEPWLEFSRSMLRRGKLPLWNSFTGCGSPLLANGQSAVFDPFHAIAYLGTLPRALAWMAAARLWVAGVGMFLLARCWRIGPFGRWFAGLAYPFCGFMTVWLLFPLASVAAWLPWLFWATERHVRKHNSCSGALVSLIAGFVLLGGHVQTSAHVLGASFLYVIWRRWRTAMVWLGWVALGVGVAAIEIVPLGAYLARSPVWADREAEGAPAWALVRPRILDAACTAMPYVYGSQRRGMPNFAKALGVHNLNESAAGFAGLATLLWLAPLAWAARGRYRRVAFLAALLVFGVMGAFGVPPVANLFRALPIIKVIDNRRLLLWVAFCLVLLGAFGIERLPRAFSRTGQRRTVSLISPGLWNALAFILFASAIVVSRAGPWLQARATAHYAAATAKGLLDETAALRNAERQVRDAVTFLPRYYAATAALLLGMSWLYWAHRRGLVSSNNTRLILTAATIGQLFAFGFGLNPAIAPELYRAESEVIRYLKRVAPPPARIVAIGAELPPNVLMRFGLSDVRNYDSVELSRSLAWFEPIYEASAEKQARTSRRSVTWTSALRGLDRLKAAGVTAIVGATPPPSGTFEDVVRVGSVWVARVDKTRLAGIEFNDHGEIWIDARGESGDRKVVFETFDPGWRGELDGRPVPVDVHAGSFLSTRIAPGGRRLVLRYEPFEVRIALWVSGVCLVLTAFCFASVWPLRLARKKLLPSLSRRNGRVRIGVVIPSRFHSPADL